MHTVQQRHLVVGIAIVLTVGMGIALAAGPAGAQTQDRSNSWFDGGDDSSLDDGTDDRSSGDDWSGGSDSDSGSSDWFDDRRDGNDSGDSDEPDDGGGSGDGDESAGTAVQSASAQVTDTTYFSGRVQEVTVTFTATEGAQVELTAGSSSEVVRATGGQQQATVQTGGMFWGISSPVDVSVAAGDSECAGAVRADGRQSQLCEGTTPDPEPEPEPNFDVGVAGTNSPVTEGETLTIDATAENTGDAAGTQDVTVSVAGQSQTESVALDPGESRTVSVSVPTQQGTAGTYTASVSTDGDSASVAVTVEAVATDGTIQGTVVDSETGDAIAGATVAAGGTQATTGADGSYSLALSEGSYTLQVSADGYQSTSQSVQVTAGETATADVALSPTTPEPDPATFQLSNPSANAPTAGQAITVDATVENTGGQEGTQTVSLSVGSLGSDSQDVTLGAGESTSVSLSVATSQGDAGTYSADLATADASVSTTVSVNEAVTEGTVEGTVTDSGSGQGVGGATVSAGGAETTTAADGSYSLTLSEGSYTLQVSADGYQSASQSITVTAGETATADVGLTATPDPATFELSNPSANAPTAGQAITVDATVENTGEQDGTQTVSLNVGSLGTDSQDVTLGAGESTSVSLSVETSAGDAGTHSAELNTADDSVSTTVSVSEPVTDGTVSGTVTDADSGQGIGGATVSAGDVETTTADDGSYSLTLTEGDYTVSANADGYESASQSVTVTAGETATADVGLTATPDPANFEIAGLSANAPTLGEPVSVDVTIQNAGGQEATQTVSLSLGSAGSASQAVTLGAGESTTVTLSVSGLGSPGTYTAQVATADATATTDVTVQSSTGTVTGTVTDADSANPVAGATVSANGAETTTASDGSYSLTLEAGAHTVEAAADGYQPASQSVTVTAGETSTVDLQIAPEAAGPQEFTAYVRGTEGYLHMNTTSPSSSPMSFTECRDGTPTQQAVDQVPDYLPEPTCVAIEGTHYPSNDTWHGTIDFPQLVTEAPPPAGGAGPGELYVRTEIQSDSAGGTLDADTGEMTLEADASIDVAIYNVSSHGVTFDPNGLEQLTESTCRVPDLGLSASTENSYESSSSFTGSGTVQGQRLDDSTVAVLAGNDFAVSGATDCGNMMGVQLNSVLNRMLGLPADASRNELAMDVDVQFGS